MQRRTFIASSAATAIAAMTCPDNAKARPRSANSSRVDDDREAARRYASGRRYVDLSAGRVAYIDRGRGPVALFLHGFPLNGFQWRGAIERLSTHRRCVAPDLLGLGYTQVAPGQNLAPSAQADMIAAFLDRLKISSVDLVASDSGGAVAQLFVTRHPGRTRTLLLTNCDAEPDSPPPSFMPIIQLARAGKYADLLLEPWLKNPQAARAPKSFGGQCYNDPDHPTDAALEVYLTPLVASPERKRLVNDYTVALDPNPLAGVEAKLRRFDAPTRLVWGMADRIFSSSSPDYLDKLLPKSRGILRLPHAKVFFPEEMPDLIAHEARTLWLTA
jgi:pimeloyl-ACP methyl ester carboxylesterase